MIKFIVYGDPVAQGRPRFTTAGGFARAYDPAKSRDYKQYVRQEALKVKPVEIIFGPIALTVKTYRSIPKSFSKRRRTMALNGTERPITKPDLDNVIKGIKDALKSVIWKDDSQVVDFIDCGKWYSDTPRIEVIVKEIEVSYRGKNGVCT